MAAFPGVPAKITMFAEITSQKVVRGGLVERHERSVKVMDVSDAIKDST